MEIRNLRTFIEVSRRLSFHRAARALNMAQSTVSAQIHSLEEELGVRLFDRLGRRIQITEAGGNLLNYARKIVDIEQEARGEVGAGGGGAGALTIRVPESLCVHGLPPVIAGFRRRLPAVGLELITCSHEGLVEDLRKGVIDLAFLLTESISGADLEVQALGSEPLVLVAAPGHPLASRQSLDTAGLAGETLLLTRVDCSYRRLLHRFMKEKGVSPGQVLEFYSVDAVKTCAAAGLGITLAPRFALRKEFADGSLVPLPWSEGEPEVAVLMIWHREKWLSPSLHAFMDAARADLMPSLAGP